MRRSWIALSAFVIPTTASALGPQPPDQVDVFFQTNVRPQIELLLDSSCSMADDAGVAYCPWFEDTFGVTTAQMQRKDNQLKASLIGCARSDDGVIDKWASRVNFAIRGFESGTPSVWRPFGSSALSLENALNPTNPDGDGYSLGGGTSMTLGLREAGRDFAVFNDGNTLSCRPNIILLLSDGNPNSNGGNFNYECSPPPDSRSYGPFEPWCGSGYLAGSIDSTCTPPLDTPYADMVCGVSGDQIIETYTIGFGRNGTFSPSNLQRVAANGKGQYFYAGNVSALDNAFNEIITAVSNRPIVTYSPPAVSLDGVFSGNSAYSLSFTPAAQGFWAGNLKASCLLPGVATNGSFNGSTSCFYLADPSNARQLIANPTPVDIYSGTAVADARVGGAGQRLRNRLSTTAGGTTPASPFFPRNLLTWRPGTSTLFSVATANLNPDDLFLHGIERPKLINRLHGYTFDVQLSLGGGFDDDVSGLDPNDWNPQAVATWPLAETLNSNLTILSYANNTQYLIAPMNDGMLHSFRSSDGTETSALMMGEVLTPNPALNFSIRDTANVFNNNVRHPYLLDGAQRLFHEDANADGRIATTETARLFTGLGRAGAGYYMTNVQDFNGTFDATRNPVYPLLRQAGTHYQDLADTWAAPWVGRMRMNGANYRVAIFGSGHERGFDEPTAQIPSSLPGEWQVSGVQSLPCSSILSPTDCLVVDAGLPVDIVVGPVSLPNAIAYRLRFATYLLSPGDELRIQSGEGSTADVVRGLVGLGYTTRWVYDDQIAVQAITDSIGGGVAVLDSVEYRTATQLPARRRSPSLFVVDIDRWNGTTPQRFAATTSDAGMLLRFTADCGGSDTGTRCFDPTLGPAYSDLRYMRCPISGEVSVLDAGGTLERAYIGDECGQIWRMALNPASGQWNVNRVFNANSDAGAPLNWPASGVAPVRNIRKIMHRIDLVRSRCTGKNAIGLYFGTGNAQRPNAQDERRDIFGVVWDDGTLNTSTGIDDMLDATNLAQVTPETDVAAVNLKGWYVNLRANERMLRDPIVFAQTAYFKTFRATVPSTECTPGSGEDSVWSLNSCSAEAYNDQNSDGVHQVAERIAQSAQGDIGASPEIVATRDTAVVLSDQGSLNRRQNFDFRKSRLLNWRGSK